MILKTWLQLSHTSASLWKSLGRGLLQLLQAVCTALRAAVPQQSQNEQGIAPRAAVAA